MILAAADPWAWKWHPEVWLLVGIIVGFGFYVTRVIGPKVVRPGQPITTRREKGSFIAATGLLLLAADWPMHDIAENYLYSVHMVQHMIITFVVPPLFLMSVPEWLARLVILDGGRGSKVLRWFAQPVIAGVLFNALVALTHFSGLVNASVDNGPLHFGLHFALFGAALLMWTPVCGPLPELRLSLPGQMVYLFLMSIIPTIPAAWLTFAEGTVYTAYDVPDRLWGISVTSDQQAAGLIMKLIGGFYLWGLIIVLFYRWSRQHEELNRRPYHVPENLTYDDVATAFDEAGPAPPERRIDSDH